MTQLNIVRQILLTVGILWGMACVGLSQTPTQVSGQRLVWQEEFNGTTADLDGNWNFQNGPNGHILCSRWRENAVVTNGVCRLINRKENRGGQAWTSASLWTKRLFQYGTFE